jgi:hypothetical protein
MKRIIPYLLFMLVFSVFTPLTPSVLAHGTDHGPTAPTAEPISEKKAAELATNIVESIIQKGKIAKSWIKIKPAETVKKLFTNRQEWVVAFKNPVVEDKSKQTLYVFLSLTGEYLAANFTGS